MAGTNVTQEQSHSSRSESEVSVEWTLHKFIDSHIGQLRLTAFGLASLATVLILRKIKVTRRFAQVSDIPAEFIHNNTILQGQVRIVTESGVLLIDHIPILNKKQFFLRHSSGKDNGLLPVSLAGILINSEAELWLKKTMIDKHVWFMLLEASETAVECDVKMKMSILKYKSLNEELIRQGLCMVRDFNSLPTSKCYHQLLIRLVAHEKLAVRKKKGIWKEEKIPFKVWMKGKIQFLLKKAVDKIKTISVFKGRKKF